MIKLKDILLENDAPNIFVPRRIEDRVERYIKQYIRNGSKGNLSLIKMDLVDLPAKLSNVTVGGYFDCSHNQLTSLSGTPQSVGGFFDCSNNKLTSLNEAPAPVIEPPTKPSSPPAPTKPTKPTTRPNPLKPTRPGIAPRPKALRIDTGDEMPDLIDPSKRAKIENEKDYVEQILPDLGPEADRYLEIITSQSYQQNIKRVAYYLSLIHI